VSTVDIFFVSIKFPTIGNFKFFAKNFFFSQVEKFSSKDYHFSWKISWIFAKFVDFLSKIWQFFAKKTELIRKKTDFFRDFSRFFAIFRDFLGFLGIPKKWPKSTIFGDFLEGFLDLPFWRKMSFFENFEKTENFCKRKKDSINL